MKKCSKCGEWKLVSEFHKKKNTKDGLQSNCKKCRNEYYENNKDQILEQRKEYYENNKEKIKEYYENNKDQIKEYYEKYYENNKEKILEQQKEYRENNYVRIWCTKTIYDHKRRGYIVNMTIDELYNIVKDKPICEICGKELEWYFTGTGKVSNLSPTLDRIYNENEINKDNISILCHKCNVKKNSETLEENVIWCNQYLEYANNIFRR